jgi:hypothetical protein
MHRIPLLLKVIEQTLCAIYREGIKGHADEPTVASDFLV